MEPTLVLQMQRMGDLVIAFPLLSWLQAIEPERPVWVVAEEEFAEALLPLAPSVVFFPPEAQKNLLRTPVHRVINLSHREDAALLAGKMPANTRLGRYRDDAGAMRIGGAWHLYRASLVHNNRHNMFHWADLNAMDIIPGATMQKSAWPEPRKPVGSRIGLFVGASETSKRPEPEFWAELAKELMRKGYKPVFLGGKAEQGLGAKAAQLAAIKGSNFCGQFSLIDLVRFMAELDMLITPDTGPMHIGAWAGALTLNLSMGPVSPWETAPFPPGHYVVSPSCSCRGCWTCTHPKQENACKGLFVPHRIASLAHSLLVGAEREDEKFPHLPGLFVWRTRRAPQGIFDLLPVDGHKMDVRRAVDNFWRQWFLAALGGPYSRMEYGLQTLNKHAAHMVPVIKGELGRVGGIFAKWARLGVHQSSQKDFWQNAAPVFRPFTGYAHMLLENGDYSKASLMQALAILEHLQGTL